jgi:GNAT superfamily N-acetyltransferase
LISLQQLQHYQAHPKQWRDGLHLLKIAAHRLDANQIEQWKYWIDPPVEKVEWLKNGFQQRQFYFYEADNQIIAMYRLMEQDLDYWGKQENNAYYLHSLVVHPDFKGLQLGSQILQSIMVKAKKDGKLFLRLDCDASNSKLCQYYIDHCFKQVDIKKMPLSTNAMFQMKI